MQKHEQTRKPVFSVGLNPPSISKENAKYTFIPNNIVIKTENSMILGVLQRGRFAQSIDIDGGKQTLYLYSYEKDHIYFATDFTFLQY